MLNKDVLQAMRVDMDKALAAVGEKYGAVIKSGNCTFEANRATFKVLVTTNGFDSGRADFENHAVWDGFDKSDFGKTFAENGIEYTICGWASKSHRFPVLAKRSDGKVFKFPTDSVLRKIGKGK